MTGERNRQNDRGEDFRVDLSTHLLGGSVRRLRKMWLRLGALESRVLEQKTASIAVLQPVFIAGLARAGTTILLEYCVRHHGAVSHQYRDFPFIDIPYWWNRFLGRVPQRAVGPAERSHRDGVFITRESPEAMEEMLWMAFFPQAHDPRTSSVLDAVVSNPPFEHYYRDHIVKLLLVRGGTRYVSKNNYNLTRMEYLLRQFPDCRFVIPVRGPAGHIASLMKQHRLFCENERRHPRALEHMRRTGHFEFGLDRRPINAGDAGAAAGICDLWEAGDEVRGWARYWAHLHGYVADMLERNRALRKAALVIRFEELCDRPRQVLAALSTHCALEARAGETETFAASIRYPSYYKPSLTPRDLGVIEEETAATALRLGYLKKTA